MPSKLGIHGIMPGETPAVVQQLRAAGARMTTVKAVVSIGWLREIKTFDPEIITVGRLMKGANPYVNVEGPDLNKDLKESATEVMGSLLPRWKPHRDYVDYWEIINEQDPDGPEGHRRLAEFMMHCMDIANQEGYKLALFSYSLGVPEWDEMEAIVEAGTFTQAKAGGHALSLHEYAYPINRWYGEPLPGRPTYPNRGPLACRYRWLYEDFLIPRDEVVPLFLTEVNIAKDLPQVSAHEWITQMAWYDNQLRKDYYVVGAHLFTLGSAGAWEEFEFGRFLPNLVNHMISIKDREDPTWPEPPPAPPPVPPIPTPTPPPGEPPSVQPRDVYSRHYLLFPPGTTWSWITAARQYWETFRVTIGFSADDAGYGPGLEERAITAVNPAQWGDDLKAFFDQHYPGVRYDPIEAATPQQLTAILSARVARGQRFG
ncbi:MAG: hypothetical protein JXC32_00790 [Anaerolineae bacterium]|nr:hypothetical protein [Anaerolineae bacterium]